MVDIRIKRLSKFNSKIVIDKLSCSVANSLRRIMISEVPTLSIDLVSIEINTSIINDEFLSHRLGLIPLKSDCAKKMKYTRECECENYCQKCSSVFNLNLKSRHQEMIVYSTHLENLEKNGDFLGHSVIPIHDSGSEGRFSTCPIILAQLKMGQQIKLTGIAKKGTGSEHSKWSPVSIIKLKAEPIFHLDLANLNAILGDSQKNKLSTIGKEFLEYDQKENSLILTKKSQEPLEEFAENDVKFLLKFLMEEHVPSEKILGLETNLSRVTFTIETTGVLETIEIFKESVSILKRKLNILGVHIEKSL
jgi:DNA-directed RNA polymerase II subunit RPB3